MGAEAETKRQEKRYTSLHKEFFVELLQPGDLPDLLDVVQPVDVALHRRGHVPLGLPQRLVQGPERGHQRGTAPPEVRPVLQQQVLAEGSVGNGVTGASPSTASTPASVGATWSATCTARRTSRRRLRTRLKRGKSSCSGSGKSLGCRGTSSIGRISCHIHIISGNSLTCHR